MPKFFVVRLGADSVPAIQQIDANTTPLPFTIDVTCKQVPETVQPGDFAFIWLGTNNPKGGKTAWKQGVRALAMFTNVASPTPSGWNIPKTLTLSVGVILNASLSREDIVNSNSVPYKELYGMPVLGGNNYSSQVVQAIDPDRADHNLGALVTVIEELRPGFKGELTAVYPQLSSVISALPTVTPPQLQTGAQQAPNTLTQGSWDVPLSSLGDFEGLVDMEEPATRALAALRAGMHIIVTGPPGTGKTKFAEMICRKAGFSSWTVPATDQWTTFETIGGYFPVPSEDSSEEKTERLDFLPGAVVEAISNGNCLIIDEINRADIDKAFGELFTLLAGNSVTLPYRRRGPNGFLRVRIEVGNVEPEVDIDSIPLPTWWRMIGAMNDADKASLKRLSLAFVRRFAFIPIGVPTKSKYSELLKNRLDHFDSQAKSDPRISDVFDKIVALFTDATSGFASIGMPFGPAIPLAMLRQAAKEAEADPARSSDALLASAIELYVVPQFQGRADKHKECAELVYSVVSNSTIAEEAIRSLAVWTGYDA